MSTSTPQTPAESTAETPLKSLRERAVAAVAAAEAAQAHEAAEREADNRVAEVRELIRLVETWWKIALPLDDVTTERRVDATSRFHAYATVEGLLVTTRDGYHGPRLYLAYRCPQCGDVQVDPSDCNQLTSLPAAIAWQEGLKSGREPCPGCERQRVDEVEAPEAPGKIDAAIKAPLIDDGGEAFPSGNDDCGGLTARDYFAAHAIPATQAGRVSYAMSAREAFVIADAMIVARKTSQAGVEPPDVNIDVEAENDRVHEMWSAALGSAHLRLTGKPLDMGDGETEEEGVGNTIGHFLQSLARHTSKLIEEYGDAPAEGGAA